MNSGNSTNDQRRRQIENDTHGLVNVPDGMMPEEYLFDTEIEIKIGRWSGATEDAAMGWLVEQRDTLLDWLAEEHATKKREAATV